MTKKFTTVLIGLAILVGPAFAFADTTSTNVQVQAMLTQISNLQAQIQALKAAQTQVQTAQNNVVGTLRLIRNLKQGMSGDDVSALQAILAADPNIFPQGSVTGFFGRLTAEAVKKFQKKHGIDALGNVGPKTLKKLNEEIEHLGLFREDQEDNDHTTSASRREDGDNGEHGKRLCIPPGHLIAPGWLKKNDRPVPTALIPLCNSKRNNENNESHHATTTPDTIAPVIYSITVTALATSSVIRWTTNELASGQVWYGTTTSLGLVSNMPVVAQVLPQIILGHVPPFTTGHNILLSNLATSTTYFYLVVSSDASGNTATSSQNSFTTTSGL